MSYYIERKYFDDNGEVTARVTSPVESKDAPLRHHTQGLSYTATGYGKRIPTRTMVRWQGKWRRVYVCQYSNAGTAYIGKWTTGRGAELTVSEG